MHIGSTPESNLLNTLDTAVMESQRTFIPLKGGTYGQFVSYCDEESDEPDDPSEHVDPDEPVDPNVPDDHRERDDISVLQENIGNKYAILLMAILF